MLCYDTYVYGMEKTWILLPSDAGVYLEGSNKCYTISLTIIFLKWL